MCECGCVLSMLAKTSQVNYPRLFLEKYSNLGQYLKISSYNLRVSNTLPSTPPWTETSTHQPLKKTGLRNSNHLSLNLRLLLRICPHCQISSISFFFSNMVCASHHPFISSRHNFLPEARSAQPL